MKLMKIEETTSRIFEVVHELFPKYKIPTEEQTHLFTAPRHLLGLGGSQYGVGANPRVYGADTGLDNYKYIDTIVHELVHHNGFRGHGPSFQRELAKVAYAVLTAIKQKYPEETKKWEVTKHEDEKTQTTVIRIYDINAKPPSW